jgi:hypothetical protein
MADSATNGPDDRTNGAAGSAAENGAAANGTTANGTAGDDVDADQAFMINPALHVVFCGNDEVLVLHGSRSDFRQVIRDDGQTKVLGRVLRHMDEPASLADLRDRGVLAADEMDDARSMVAHLEGEDVLVDPAKRLASIYMDTLHGDATPLTDATVGIVGAGPFGSRVADELARLDAGRLHVLDGRATTDLGIDRRQFGGATPFVDDGRPYVEVVSDYLEAVGYEGEVVASPHAVTQEDALQQLVDDADFVVAASEVFASGLFHALDDLTIRADTPWISAFLDGSEACIGPLYVPGETCYNEFEIQFEAALSISQSDYYAYKETMNEQGWADTTLAMPAHLSTAAGLTAGATASFLATGTSYLVGRSLRLNFEKPYVDYEEILRLPRTPTAASTRQGYRHTFM